MKPDLQDEPSLRGQLDLAERQLHATVEDLSDVITSLRERLAAAEGERDQARKAIELGTRELRRYVEGNGFQWCDDESTVFNVTTAIGWMGGTIVALRERLAAAEGDAETGRTVYRAEKKIWYGQRIALTAINTRLRVALEFYADPQNYDSDNAPGRLVGSGHSDDEYETDKGNIARTALTATTEGGSLTAPAPKWIDAIARLRQACESAHKYMAAMAANGGPKPGIAGIEEWSAVQQQLFAALTDTTTEA